MTSPTDSMWLQKSITIADPLPNDNGVSPLRKDENTPQTVCPSNTEEAGSAPIAANPPPAVPAEKENVPHPISAGECSATPRSQMRSGGGGEMDLTKMVLDTSLFASAQRPSSFRYSMRASVANAGGVSALEFDELRSRYSQAKRELLKVGDIQKDLDFARFELTRCKEELKITQTTYDRFRAELDEANQRLETERRARAEAELRAGSAVALHAKEVEFLKSQLDELRQQAADSPPEMPEEQEAEYQRRIENMREELSTLLAEHDQLKFNFANCESEREAAVRQQQDVREELESVMTQLVEAKQRVEQLRGEMELDAKRYTDKLEASHREHDSELAAQKRIYQDRLAELGHAKEKLKEESEEECRDLQDKLRHLRDELSTMRQRNTQLEQDMQQSNVEHERQLNRLVEEHRLALSEKALQMEAAVREARSSKVSIDEENYSLRRKASQLTEELSTVSAVLAQREREREGLQHKLADLKESATQKDMEYTRLLAELELHAGGLEEANERLARLQKERDELEDGYSADLRTAKDRIRELEQKLMTAETDISKLRRETMLSQDSGLSTVKDLRLENDALRTERDQLQLDVADKQHVEAMLADTQRKLSESQRHSENLQVELRAVAAHNAALERRLDEALRRHISQSRTSPGNATAATSVASGQGRKRASQPLRSVSCTNQMSPAPGAGSSLKRARTEDARVVAISGFDGKELLMALKQLPGVALAECQSNVPVPSNLTHLITNGHATVKLLTALVRGCWVLPARYVTDSLEAHSWLPESEYGFQHENPPLQKKHIAMTDAFKGMKFHSNADLLLREGGAIFETDPEEADIVLCANRELEDMPRGLSWEGFVEMIYPVKLDSDSAAVTA